VTEFTYEEACALAATEQGLGPAHDILVAGGLEVSLAQTGGMCMAIEVKGDGFYIMVTDGEEWTGDPGWLVCLYEDDADHSEAFAELGDRITDADLLSIVVGGLEKGLTI